MSGSECRLKRNRGGKDSSPTRSPPAKKKFDNNPKGRLVYLVGFSKVEKKKKESDVPSRLCKFTEDLADLPTHIVFKCLQSLKTNYDWFPIHYALLTDAWLLYPAWLEALKKEVHDEDYSITRRTSCIDAHLQSNADFMSMGDVISKKKAYAKERQENGQGIFSHVIFQSMVVLCSRSPSSQRRGRELGVLLRAGGAGCITTDGPTVEWLRNFGKLGHAAMPSMVVLVNGTRTEEVSLDATRIRQILSLRIPILYEEFITMAIRYMISPNRETVLRQSLAFWHDALPETRVSEEMVEWLVSGEGDSPLEEKEGGSKRGNETGRRREREEKEESRETKGKEESEDESIKDIEEDNLQGSLSIQRMEKMEVDDEDGNLLEEFTREIVACDDSSPLPATRSPSPEPLSLFKPFSMPASEPREFECCIPFGMASEYLLKSSSSWKSFCTGMPTWQDTVSDVLAELPLDLPWKRNRLTDFHSVYPATLMFFNSFFDEVEENEPGTLIHDIIVSDALAALEDDTEEDVRMTISLMTKLLHEIAIPEYGARDDCPLRALSLLRLELLRCLPTSLAVRMKWLRVLTQNKEGDTRIRGKKNDMNEETQMLRDLFDRILEEELPDGVCDFLLYVFEVDLLCLQNREESSSDSAPLDEDSDEDEGHSHCPLIGFPLSLLILYDAGEKRKRGFDDSAFNKFALLVNSISRCRKDLTGRFSTLCRLASVMVEATRWYLATQIGLFPNNENMIGVDLLQSIQRIGRYIHKSEKLSPSHQRCILPAQWMADILANAD